MGLLPILFLLILFIATAGVARAEPPMQERAALLAFNSQVPHEQRVRWNASASACSWVGVTCDTGNTSVYQLRLPGVGLVGPIPAGTLGRLASLRVLSLRGNRLSGPIPDDLGNLTLLRSLYLQDNLISGEIPPAVFRLGRLRRLDLSGNNLTGEIPFSINNLTHLTGLFLERNRLSGSLPSISIDSLVGFNVSYNNLNGSIPLSLSRFPESSFAGNLNLCGAPLLPCSPFFPSSPGPSPTGMPARGSKSSKLSTAAIIAIAVGGGALLLLILLLFLIWWVFRRRERRRRREKAAKGVGAATAAAAGRSGETGMTSSSKEESGGVGGTAEGERNRLVFVGKGGGYSFDLEDLLRASAEVLGKGSVGTSYKAVLEDGTTVVVKRLKDVVATKREFELHMETLGKVDHQNLLPLRAYYYSKDEKLLVFDYLPAGSLSSLLHGQCALSLSLSLSLTLTIMILITIIICINLFQKKIKH